MDDLFEDLQWRGLVYQWTGEGALPALLRSRAITLYYGCDPSADSLHIGNLVGLVALRRFQRAGHRPIAIAGGATGMVGDPSGRSEERTLLGPDELARNVEAIRAQIGRFLDFDAGALLLNNADWLGRMSFLEFLRDVGKNVTINTMLAKESVRARLDGEGGLSYTEFSYMMMQAFDFAHLYREYDCVLQIGGSDQFGNITLGIDLGRRLVGGQLYGLTWPLVQRSDGAKMGKTAEGAVWLSPERTSPYVFFQYFVRVPDADAGAFLRIFTELPRDTIIELERVTEREPQKREAQTVLARELTRLVHGEEGLARAERATGVLFGGTLDGLTERDLLDIFADVPSVQIKRARLEGGLPMVDAFLEAGLAKSRSDARRLIEGGGGYVNNARVDADGVLRLGDLATENLMVLRGGKKAFALLRVV